MTNILESSHLYMVYSSFQLHRFLINIGLNRGTEQQPINVDNLVRVMPYPPFGSDIDPYISEVPYALKTITWIMKDTGYNTSIELSEPMLCFVEIYPLNPDQDTDENYWSKYFQLDEHSTVAPNGVLRQTPNASGNISIDLQEDEGQGDLMFGYSIVFTINAEENGEAYYCRKDPIANIRSRKTT